MPASPGHESRGRARMSPSDPTESLSPLRVAHRHQGLGRRLRRAPGTSGPESGEAFAAESQARGSPAASPRRGGGSREPSAHAPSLTDPSSARTDARRRGSRSGHAHPYRIGWSCEALPGSLAARRGSGRSHAGPLRALRAAALQTQRKGHETRDCCLSALPRPCPPGLHGMAGV